LECQGSYLACSVTLITSDLTCFQAVLVTVAIHRLGWSERVQGNYKCNPGLSMVLFCKTNVFWLETKLAHLTFCGISENPCAAAGHQSDSSKVVSILLYCFCMCQVCCEYPTLTTIVQTVRHPKLILWDSPLLDQTVQSIDNFMRLLHELPHLH